MSSDMGSIFPLLVLIVTAVLFLVFIFMKKTGINVLKTPLDVPKKAKEPRKTKPPPTADKVNIESTSIPLEEGFVNGARPLTHVIPVPPGWNPVFPTWTTPSINFAKTYNDYIYDQYSKDELEITPEQADMLNSIKIEKPLLPDYGKTLGSFDSDITSMPWDADNKDYVQSDIVWGVVSMQATLSIFSKVYHKNLLADMANFNIGEDAKPRYKSPFFGITCNDPSTNVTLQAADAIAANTVSALVPAIKEFAKEIYIGEAALEAEQAAAKAAKAAKAAAKAELRLARAAARDAKLASGKALSILEKAEEAALRLEKGFAKALKPFRAVLKTLKTLTIVTKFMAGFKIFKSFVKMLIGKLVKLVVTIVKKVAQAIGISLIITAILNLMTFLLGAGTIATFGGLAPLFAIMTMITTLWNILEAVALVTMIACMIILPIMFDKAMKNGGVCQPGMMPIDTLISDEFLYFIFANLTPIGTVIDCFQPYLCFGDGKVEFKQPLYIPPYFSDTTLSISKHAWSDAQTPRGDDTTFTNPADSVPPGWTIIGSLAYGPCGPNTFTSSPIDLLCNAELYFLNIWGKDSYMPNWEAKDVKWPPPRVKGASLMTYWKGSYYMGLPWGCHVDTVCSSWWCDFPCRCYSGTQGGLLCYPSCQEGYGAAPGSLVCIRNCQAGESDYGGICERPASQCKNGNVILGVCWEGCGADADFGLICVPGCPNDGKSYTQVLGACWPSCNSQQTDIGLFCVDNCSGNSRAKCPDGSTNKYDNVGFCLGQCCGQNDLGFICRDYCKRGWYDPLQIYSNGAPVNATGGGVCWSDAVDGWPRPPYGRGLMMAKSQKIYDPGYNPPRTIDQLMNAPLGSLPYCNFSDPVMLSRMAQFYHDKSTTNPVKLEDGRVSIEYIIMFYGVVASSELSCDVACAMKTAKFDPITGGNYEEVVGTSYPDDPGNSVSYRRFYFIQTTPDVATADTPADVQGLFTVTGCTHVDYTAPDAQIKSSDPNSEPILSLPKIFNVIDKSQNPRSFTLSDLGGSLANTGASMGLGALGGGLVSGAAAGIAGGMAGQALSNTITQARQNPQDPGASVENAVTGPDANGIFYVSTNNDNFSIDHGPIYEYRASTRTGIIPQIDFCKKVITSELLCSHKYILRDTIDLYHAQNPNTHIKNVSIIEPRGKDGCYYRVGTTTYDPATNTEGDVMTDTEFVLQYAVKDKSTCVYTPTTKFITDLTNYPIRSYFDPLSRETEYPTRRIVSEVAYQGRYIRIRPSQTATGGFFLQLSQIAVYDATYKNIALNPGVTVYATSSFPGCASPAKIIDGKLVALSGLANTWQNNNSASAAADYIEIDLKTNYFINYITYYGRIDAESSSRNAGVRVQVLFSNGPSDAPSKELTTQEEVEVQQLDYTIKNTIPSYPQSPFQVPRPLPAETNLGGTACPTRCQDKPQIDTLVAQFNSNPANASKQILKVLKAVTPSSTRCDYQVETITTEANGKKTVAKETISMGAALAGTTPNTGVLYARYLRVRPSAASNIGDGLLGLSQIVVTSPIGTNLALTKPVYATSTSPQSALASVITDGTITARTYPSTWQSNVVSRLTEYVEVDLGQSQAIQSITLYGATYPSASPDRMTGVQIEALATNEINAKPIYTSMLRSNVLQQTVKYNACTFTYTPVSTAASFIQDNTPFLGATDTSGGVFTFSSIANTVSNVFNTILSPIKTLDPIGLLNKNVTDANTKVKNTLNTVLSGMQLQGCPNTKCNDPAVLSAIMNRYNADNSVANEFGSETHTMTTVIKAGISGTNTCDVMFNDVYNLYDDYLYPPVDTQTTIKTLRFNMTNPGNCALQVSPGSSSIIDVSMNAVGVSTNASIMTPPFSPKACKINCRDPKILTSIKTALNTKGKTANIIPNFTSITQSFASGAATCEYTMTKDVTTKDSVMKTFSTESALETYASASFDVDQNTCAFTLNNVTEFDPDTVTTTVDPITGLNVSLINGNQVTLPFIFNYDNTTPSTRVNETVQILS